MGHPGVIVFVPSSNEAFLSVDERKLGEMIERLFQGILLVEKGCFSEFYGFGSRKHASMIFIVGGPAINASLRGLTSAAAMLFLR